MAGRFFDEWQPGQRITHQPSRTVTETDNLLFSAMTHNMQPLHLDAETAKASECSTAHPHTEILTIPRRRSRMAGCAIADVLRARRSARDPGNGFRRACPRICLLRIATKPRWQNVGSSPKSISANRRASRYRSAMLGVLVTYVQKVTLSKLLNILEAANCMVIPVPPSLVDFASTVSFIDMTRTTMKQLEQIAGGGRPAYTFIRLVGSRVDESKSIHREVLSMIRQVFGGSMTQSVMGIIAPVAVIPP